MKKTVPADKPPIPQVSHRPPAPPASVMQRSAAASTDQAYEYWLPTGASAQSGGAS